MSGDYTAHPTLNDTETMKEIARGPGKWIVEAPVDASSLPPGASSQASRTETICFSNICRSATIEQVVDFLRCEGCDEPESFRLSAGVKRELPIDVLLCGNGNLCDAIQPNTWTTSKAMNHKKCYEPQERL